MIHDWYRPAPLSDEMVCRRCGASSLGDEMDTTCHMEVPLAIHESTLWTIRLMREGVQVAKIPLLAGDVLEDYLHLKGIIVIGDESMWRLRWQQAKMREAEYEWMPSVERATASADTVPEPT